MFFSPTLYPEVNEILAELLSGLRSVLGDRFLGLYLYGSLAWGDFDPLRSDIDFLVVTRDVIPAETLITLKAMHARITNSGMVFAKRIEGVYIPIDRLPRYERERAVHPCLCCGGEFYGEAQQDRDWIIQRYVLRERGVIIAGPPISKFIEPVLADDLRGAVRGFVLDWWAPMLEQPDRLRDRAYQAYAILTFCRVLYTLHFGEIGSKAVSARWVQENGYPEWRGLIGCAQAWPDEPQPDAFDQTVGLLRYVVDRVSSHGGGNAH